MKISFITTIYNEEKTIEDLLLSLLNQSKLPDEIIIVDGGSTDNTLAVISILLSQLTDQISNQHVKILTMKGNISTGRNYAVKNASNKIIVCSDAGCILDKNFIKNITKSFRNETVDVVAGYYKGLSKTVFQKCLVPYVLVMPDKVNPDTFLPSARSLAFTKNIWEKAGGFPEAYTYSEDYIFARKLKSLGANIVFAEDAVVAWIPRKTYSEAFTMFYHFAFNDAKARIIRPKVVLIFVRYAIWILLLILSITSGLSLFLFVLVLLISVYLFWAVGKNYKYVKQWEAFYILPLLQFVSDAAVLKGTLMGLVGKKHYFLL